MNAFRSRAPASLAASVAFAVAHAGTPAPIGSAENPRPVVFRTQTMGTWGSLTLVTADSAAVADLAYQSLLAFHRVDSLMSNWTEISEVARINREAGKREVTVHPEVAVVLDLAQRVSRESGGTFDITVEPLVRLWGFLGGPRRVPSAEEIAATLPRVGWTRMHFDPARRTVAFDTEGVQIDLGGIAKGYGVDQAAEVLRRARVTHALVDLSGNMVAMGNAAGHRGWTVGLRDPSGRHPHLARIHLVDEAIATAGNYEQFVAADGKRYGHILDPRTGWSAQGLASVTIVASGAMLADAWDDAFFVLGSEAARELARKREDLAVVLIEPQAGQADIIWVEEQLRSRFEIEPGVTRTHTVRFF
jgi:thiamine biosynthesis lipoprotein